MALRVTKRVRTIVRLIIVETNVKQKWTCMDVLTRNKYLMSYEIRGFLTKFCPPPTVGTSIKVFIKHPHYVLIYHIYFMSYWVCYLDK